jgi:hypothetical protein
MPAPFAWAGGALLVPGLVNAKDFHGFSAGFQ